MRRIVVDAATVLSWFDEDGPGQRMRREYEAGELLVIAPRQLHVDVLAAAAARGVPAEALEQLAGELPRLRIQLQEPPLEVVARWIGGGLAAEVAAYAAVAEWLGVPLAAGDPRLIRGARTLIER